jgi:DNA processing protein
MELTEDQLHLLMLCAVPKINWNLVAREAQRPGGLRGLMRVEITESRDQARAAAGLLQSALEDPAPLEERVAQELATVGSDVSLTTVLDDDYPSNLRVIFNLPPFLFYRGELRPDDARSVAVVGTRRASSAGVERARSIATELVAHGVTVLSGLARGIDTVAHEAALDADGRTIAVFGTGINSVYPKENAAVAERIVASRGALVSQFWPTAAPTEYSFPMRNVVTSGLGQGTVVVEASGKSGARNQARRALEHGKRVFLMRELVTREEWARRYVDRGALEVDSAEEIVELLRSPAEIEQLSGRRLQLELDLV